MQQKTKHSPLVQTCWRPFFLNQWFVCSWGSIEIVTEDEEVICVVLLFAFHIGVSNVAS